MASHARFTLVHKNPLLCFPPFLVFHHSFQNIPLPPSFLLLFLSLPISFFLVAGTVERGKGMGARYVFYSILLFFFSFFFSFFLFFFLFFSFFPPPLFPKKYIANRKFPLKEREKLAGWGKGGGGSWALSI